jgi:pilus assembly protein CpaC
MRHKSGRAKILTQWIFIVLGFGLWAGASLPALAQPPAAKTNTAPGGSATASKSLPGGIHGSIDVAQGSGKIITLSQPVSSIFAADPAVVEVRPASPTSLFVFGKGIGETTLVATDANGGQIAQYSVVVTPSRYAADRLAGQPGAGVSAQSEAGGMIVRGTVPTAEAANNVMNQAKLVSPSGNVINQLQVSEPIQVELKVRIAYMSRGVTRQLGINWGSIGNGFNIGKFLLSGATATESPTVSGSQAGSLGVTFPGGTFEGIIDALASDNLAHIVAEPTLTALSGTQASFLVGGQFPVPVAEQNDVITIDFKSYGVQLVFTPTVFSDGRISLQVSPTLSQLSNANSVTESSAGSSSAITVPSLVVEQASTTVILGSGQGMAIAGLLEDQSNQTTNAVPGIGEIPVLGALFRGDSFSRQQQELVITVTPYLVKPVSDTGLLAQPDDGWTPPNDLQRILLLRNNGTTPPVAAIPGDSGFIVQ